MQDVREFVVEWAKWFADNKEAHRFNYSEGPERMSAIGVWPIKFPVTCDCSAFVTLCYWLAGAPDPNGQNYDHEGYTGTLLGNGTEIAAGHVAPGDVIVYGPGTGWHTAIVVEGGADPLTVSMGQAGDPSYVRVSQDGRLPQRYLRFNLEAVGTIRQPETNKVATAETRKIAPVVTEVAKAPLRAVESVLEGPEPIVEPESHQHVNPVVLVEELIEGIIKGPAE
jgi:hypothetical protein